MTWQAQNERGYHIFSALLAGADANLREALSLRDASTFSYMNKSNCFEVEGIDDKAEFTKVWVWLCFVNVNYGIQLLKIQ